MDAPHVATLRWQCRRGMLELDLILNRFLDVNFNLLTESERCQFKKMLEIDDPTLYAWLTGAERPTDSSMRVMVERCIKKS